MVRYWTLGSWSSITMTLIFEFSAACVWKPTSGRQQLQTRVLLHFSWLKLPCTKDVWIQKAKSFLDYFAGFMVVLNTMSMTLGFLPMNLHWRTGELWRNAETLLFCIIRCWLQWLKDVCILAPGIVVGSIKSQVESRATVLWCQVWSLIVHLRISVQDIGAWTSRYRYWHWTWYWRRTSWQHLGWTRPSDAKRFWSGQHSAIHSLLYGTKVGRFFPPPKVGCSRRITRQNRADKKHLYMGRGWPHQWSTQCQLVHLGPKSYLYDISPAAFLL